MKKSTIYLISIVVFCLAVAGIIINYNHKQKEESSQEYGLLPRKGDAAKSTEWEATKKKSKELLAALKTDPARYKVWVTNGCLTYKRSTHNRQSYLLR